MCTASTDRRLSGVRRPICVCQDRDILRDRLLVIEHPRALDLITQVSRDILEEALVLDLGGGYLRHATTCGELDVWPVERVVEQGPRRTRILVFGLIIKVVLCVTCLIAWIHFRVWRRGCFTFAWLQPNCFANDLRVLGVGVPTEPTRRPSDHTVQQLHLCPIAWPNHADGLVLERLAQDLLQAVDGDLGANRAKVVSPHRKNEADRGMPKYHRHRT